MTAVILRRGGATRQLTTVVYGDLEMYGNRYLNRDPYFTFFLNFLFISVSLLMIFLQTLRAFYRSL